MHERNFMSPPKPAKHVGGEIFHSTCTFGGALKSNWHQGDGERYDHAAEQRTEGRSLLIADG